MVHCCLSDGEKAKQRIPGFDGHQSTKDVKTTCPMGSFLVLFWSLNPNPNLKFKTNLFIQGESAIVKRILLHLNDYPDPGKICKSLKKSHLHFMAIFATTVKIQEKHIIKFNIFSICGHIGPTYRSWIPNHGGMDFTIYM